MKVNVLVDSSAWIEFFTEGPKAKKVMDFVEKANKETYKTPSIVIYEVYKRIKTELNEDKANQAVAHISDSTEIITVTDRIALHAAEISIQSGLAMADSIIKATAELNDAVLKTMDNHFKGLKEVEII